MSRFVQMHVDDLKLGMFVAELDRPWIETPFLTQGFTIRDVDELATLRDLCLSVEVDIGRSRVIEHYELKASHGGIKRAKVVSKFFTGKTITTYEDVFSFEDELGTARKVYEDYEKVVGDLFRTIVSNGRLDMDAINETVHSVVESIIRNPDACMLLAAIRDKDSYSYSHAMASSILAAAVGRQIGLPKRDLSTLAKGALLCDVGKLKISARILNKSSPLSESEIAVVREHVERGVEILEESEGIDEEIINTVAHHHERHNGSGYPKGCSGNQIPTFARIAGLVDCYDAMVSDRAYAFGISPADAISKLYTMRDLDFQGELIEEFIQTVGVYPVGSLIELTDGKVAIVVTEHRRRRLRPRILVVLSSEKKPVQEGIYINMLDTTEDDMGRPLEILKGLEPGVYGVNTEDLFF